MGAGGRARVTGDLKAKVAVELALEESRSSVSQRKARMKEAAPCLGKELAEARETLRAWG